MKKAGMLDLCSTKNQGAGVPQVHGRTMQATLNTRQLIALHVEDRITVASENHIYGQI